MEWMARFWKIPAWPRSMRCVFAFSIVALPGTEPSSSRFHSVISYMLDRLAVNRPGVAVIVRSAGIVPVHDRRQDLKAKLRILVSRFRRPWRPARNGRRQNRRSSAGPAIFSALLHAPKDPESALRMRRQSEKIA